METTENQAIPVQNDVQPEPGVPMSPIKMTPLLKMLLLILAVLFGLVIVVLLVFPQAPPAQQVVVPSPLPSAGASTEPVTRPVSQFGQGLEFVAFEEKLKNTRVQQESLDLNESQLTFPLLEMNVNFDD
jgi:hypothetical protein